MNPLQGYSMQSERIWDSPNLFSKLAENTRTDSDDKDDSEDHDDDVNETAYLNKVNQEGQLPAFNRNQLVIFAYHDRLSQAHTYPITTPPDTYLDHLNC